MGLFESFGTVSYLPSIVTMALSCIISEITRVVVKNRELFHTHLHLTPPYREEGCPSKYCRTVWYEKKTRMAGLPDGEKSLMIYLAVSIEYRRVTTSRDRPLLRCRPGGWTETVRRDWSTKRMAGRTVLSLKIIFYHDNL